MDLPGGFGWTREFDRLKLETGREKPGDRALVIGDATPGAGYGEMGGRKIHAVWGDTASGECDEIVELRTSALDFPLRLRAWAPGDRMVLSYGTKKLRKLMAEARIPRSDRGAVPVLVDARGRVIWAAGLPVSTRAQAREGEPSFFLGFRNAHER
jgi:tRNA(Ile)-lysidine synthetase-like protein